MVRLGNAPEFAGRLRQVRRLHRLTQEELAERSSVSNVALSYYERDKRRPCLDQFVSLLDALGVSADFLLGRTDVMARPGDDLDQLCRRIGALAPRDLQRVNDLVTSIEQHAPHADP